MPSLGDKWLKIEFNAPWLVVAPVPPLATATVPAISLWFKSAPLILYLLPFEILTSPETSNLYDEKIDTLYKIRPYRRITNEDLIKLYGENYKF